MRIKLWAHLNKAVWLKRRTTLLLVRAAVTVCALGSSVPASAAISYVQGAYSNPDSGSTLTVTYAWAQAAGDLNVVFIGWNDATSSVQSVTDTAGNTYIPAIVPVTSPNTATQQIYYAKNIQGSPAGGNAVTVTFSTTVGFPDVRVLEYSGLDTSNPFDAAVGASGSGTAQNSGSLTTSGANDLLVAGNYIADVTTAADPNYTQRLITNGGEIIEDQVITAAGTYSASATQGASDWWLMQMMAFRAPGGGGGDTTAPSSPTGLTASAPSSTQVNLSWTASTDNVGVTGYLVERCQGSGCSNFVQTGSSVSAVFNDALLSGSVTYSYRVRATDASGNFSAYSSVATVSTPGQSIAYVQGSDSNPDSGNPVAATYPSAQISGDLNVVIVGWADTSSSVQSVTDTQGNTYVAAVGPTTIPGSASQIIYYAKNIASAGAGANTVTVTFSTTVGWPDVRILEYSGIDPANPFDIGVGANGGGLTQDSGALTTTNANDLLVASNYLSDVTTASDPSYVQRFITSGGELVEDRVVGTTGIYHATSSQGQSGVWLMQLGAFRGRAGGGDTQPPTSPTGLTASAASSSQINLSWAASTDNVGVTAYLVERCAGSGCANFAQIASVASTGYSDTGLNSSTTYSYRVRATDASGNLSSYSSVASGTTSGGGGGDTSPPTAPSGLTADPVSISQVNLSWTASTDNVGVTGYLIERCQGASCSTFTQIAASTTTDFGDMSVTASTSYTYRVRATDAAANLSAYSNTANASTPSGGGSGGGSGNTTSTYVYDAQGHLKSVTTAAGSTTQYTYDAAGHLIGIATTP